MVLGLLLSGFLGLWWYAPALGLRGEEKRSGQWRCRLSACGFAAAHTAQQGQPLLCELPPRDRLPFCGKYHHEWCRNSDFLTTHLSVLKVSMCTAALGQVGVIQPLWETMACFSWPPIFLNKIRVGKGKKAFPFFHVKC